MFRLDPFPSKPPVLPSQDHANKYHHVDIDMLSNLPDSIICQIISNLETREAVSTTFLSSRYKTLWMNINSLKFTDWLFRGPHSRFAHFVTRILALLNSNSLNKFSVRVTSLTRVYDVRNWCSSAIAKNLKVLKLVVIDREYDYYVCMPSCLYTCETLQLLKICGDSLSLDVPEFVCLPNLTRLRLERVKYSSDESTRRLISGCTSLEYLRIVRDEYDGVKKFSIASETLKLLVYSISIFHYHLHSDLKLELNAPALRELYLSDDVTTDFSVVNLCALENAQIQVFFRNDTDSHHQRVVTLLQGVYSVKHLWITGHTLEVLSHVREPPMFARSSILSMVADDCESTSLQELLQGSDESYDMYLSKDSSDTSHVVTWSEPEELPICLLSWLETISVSGFRGWEGELNMIAYILKNAQALEKMSISVATSEARSKFELLEKILKFDQGSGRCEITLS